MILPVVLDTETSSPPLRERAQTSSRLSHAAVVEATLRMAAAGGDRSHEVARLALRLGISPRTLERAFRAQQGCTVRDALARLRLNTACRLLAETNDSITAVAHQAGYCSASKMCDVFRARLNQTPRQYRVAERLKQLEMNDRRKDSLMHCRIV